MPFEVIGAPWITDPQVLADAMNARGLAGVQFQPVFFTPTSSVHAGRQVGGVRLEVTDRDALRAVTVGLALGRELMERYPGNFRPAAIQNLLVNRSTMWSILRGDPFARILAWADSARNASCSAARPTCSTSSAADRRAATAARSRGRHGPARPCRCCRSPP